MKTYLITGAAGFIGGNFIKYMLAKYPEIKIVVLDLLTYAGNLGTIAEDIDGERCEFVKGNICDRALTDELFAKYQFDYVVNFAAESHVDRSIENPQLFLVTNILGTQNLLDSARKAWVTGKAATGYPEWREGVRFHQVSTDEVYGSLGAEGDGTNVRDWLYVEDHCKAIDLVIHKGRAGEVYNVGGHNEKQNIEIVKLTISTIRRLMTEQPEYRRILKKKEIGADGQISIDWINDSLITFVKDRLGHDQRYAIDPTKITNELGWTPETSFETGIVKTIRWYLDNQKWVEDITGGDYMKYYERMYGNR